MTLKFGRKAPKKAPALRLASFLAAVPAHPQRTDYLAPLPGWQMLGNDQYGDCVAVTWANVRRLMTNGTTYPDLQAVETFYKTQNPAFPAEDNGMDIQTALEALHHDGGPDGVKAVAFASVDTTNLEEVKAALAIFGYVWTGVNVQSQNMADFDAGRAWDYRPADHIEGGHSIISGGYSGNLNDDVQFITWAEQTGFTDNFWHNLVEEAWVCIWPEHFNDPRFLDGVNTSQLAADYKSLTGNDLPIPTPPAPGTGPDAADSALYAASAIWMAKRHEGPTHLVSKALLEWAHAKGFLK